MDGFVSFVHSNLHLLISNCEQKAPDGLQRLKSKSEHQYKFRQQILDVPHVFYGIYNSDILPLSCWRVGVDGILAWKLRLVAFAGVDNDGPNLMIGGNTMRCGYKETPSLCWWKMTDLASEERVIG
jgi:hypothetical protein